MSQPPADKLASLLKLAHDLGREDRGLAMLGEGNISCRLDEDTFLVKASGSSMVNLQAEQLVACRFSALLPLLKAGPLSDAEVEQTLLASRVDPSQPKPSVEAVFHAYFLSLPGIDVVGHTHPVAVNSILCGGDGPSRRFASERRFPDEIVCCGAKSVLVPYVDPGTILAQKILEQTDAFITAENRPPRIILAATLMAEKTAKIFLGASALGSPTALSPQNVARIDSRPDEHYRQRMLKM
jgi:rhamnose utilization protein RhaD (predicted bifunctional aldolase and dehydrogenase)